MRVLICIATMEGGGAERQVTYLARALIDAGADVHVALINGGVNLDRLMVSGATVHWVDMYPKSFRLVIPIVRLLRRVRPDILYLWQRPFDVLGAIASLGSSAACVHAERTDPALVPRGVKASLRRLLVPFASGVISNSQAGAAYWLACRRRRGPVVIIPNIIPFDELAAVDAAEMPASGVIAAGRLDASKNVLTLVEAVASLKRRGTVVPLSIVGEGPLRSTLDALVANAGLDAQVTVHGYRSDVWSLMKGSAVFVSLSRYEGEPNAVLEAATLGCRLVLSDIPAHRSLIPADGATFVDPDSVEAVAIGLTHALRATPGTTNPEQLLRERFAAAVGQRHISFFEQILREVGPMVPTSKNAGTRRETDPLCGARKL
jgi:glycosyltransferase involved in cell wall biosynthesis